MNDLTYTLRQLCQRNRDNCHATQADRLTTLTMISRQLLELGFRQMRASSLKGKHVEALLALWQSEGLAAGTQKNRMVYGAHTLVGRENWEGGHHPSRQRTACDS